MKMVVSFGKRTEVARFNGLVWSNSVSLTSAKRISVVFLADSHLLDNGG